MQSLRRHPSFEILRLSISRSLPNPTAKSSSSFPLSSYSIDSNNSKKSGEDEWNDAWESAWLPEDLTAAKNRAHWEIDVNFSKDTVVLSPDVDANTKAFVQDMDENWNQRRRGASLNKLPGGNSCIQRLAGTSDKESLESMKKDYRLKKQRIHAGLWMKEIEKEEETRLGTSSGSGDIERLLDSCSEIFDSGSNELNDLRIPSTNEFKTKPDGWETTSKAQDGSIWEMSQREEDILLQEFERRIAFSKFQIASFIKSHIFSRRRPIDGWKYMIEELGPNAKRGKGSALRLPSLSDSATQPFKEDKVSMGGNLTPYKRSLSKLAHGAAAAAVPSSGQWDLQAGRGVRILGGAVLHVRGWGGVCLTRNRKTTMEASWFSCSLEGSDSVDPGASWAELPYHMTIISPRCMLKSH